jgi:hypothetical protein
MNVQEVADALHRLGIAFAVNVVTGACNMDDLPPL